jgi:hypothetical protein
VFAAFSIYLSLHPMFNGYCSEVFVKNFVTFVLSRFRDILFAENSFDRELCFHSMQKSSKILLHQQILWVLMMCSV